MREQASQQAKHRRQIFNRDMRAEREMRAVPGDDGAAEPPRPRGWKARLQQRREERQRGERGEPRKPWVLRLLLAFGAALAALGRLIIRFSRHNMLFALGIACFILLFIALAYNAFFKQKPVARPVLFSTRAVEVNESGPRPFVARAISTEALQREAAAAPRNSGGPAPADSHDAVGDLIRSQERLLAAAEINKPRERPAAKRLEAGRIEAKAEIKAGAAGKMAVPSPRPAYDSRLLPTRERVLRLQKALRKAGDKGLAASGKWDAKTRSALRRFKKHHGLADNDEIDAATIAKMQKLHLW